MGIKGLWSVLTPYSEKKSLHEIRGETLAVDLSGWVCDSQNVTEYHIQPKLYLRNLFFRTVYLILADINPIFVLEGDAPELKRDVMAARNATQFRGVTPRHDIACRKKPDIGRKRFKGILKECESLLKYMGVQCVKGNGEAEATCAYLNTQGLVDAVVSQDSDCFAYGARRVYRNFSVSNSAGGGALQGSVDCYDAGLMFKSNGFPIYRNTDVHAGGAAGKSYVSKKLVYYGNHPIRFGRNKMVALALLCGCDYGVGACGSSINTVVSFLHTVPEDEVIPRLLLWVSDPEQYEERRRWAEAPGRCDRCGHAGRSHTKKGCPVCVTHNGCRDNAHKSKVSEVKRELSLRTRALSSGIMFPEPKIMKEFLNRPQEKIDLNELNRPTPSLIQFVRLMSYKLDWSERYCVEKFLPILTKWHLRENVPCGTIKATLIKKKRAPRGVPSFEVVWTDIEGQYEGLIPDDQFEDDEDPFSAWTTTERQDLMRKFYPEIVESYEESIKKPPKEKKLRKKKDKDSIDKPKKKYNRKPKNVPLINDVNESLNNPDLKNTNLNLSKANVSLSINKLKRKIKNSSKKGQKTIDSFITGKKRKTNKILINSLRHSFKRMSLINNDNACTGLFSEFKYSDDLFDGKENLGNNLQMENQVKSNHYLSILDKSEDDDNELDVSDIIDKIISRSPEVNIAKVDDNVVKLIFDKYSTPKKNSLRKSVLSQLHNNCSTPNGSPINSFRLSAKSVTSNKSMCKVNTSYFFDKLTENGDAFEMSLEHKSAVVSLDSTVDYSLPNVYL